MDNISQMIKNMGVMAYIIPAVLIVYVIGIVICMKKRKQGCDRKSNWKLQQYCWWRFKDFLYRLCCANDIFLNDNHQWYFLCTDCVCGSIFDCFFYYDRNHYLYFCNGKNERNWYSSCTRCIEKEYLAVI